jgi:hypothetical protein
MFTGTMIDDLIATVLRAELRSVEHEREQYREHDVLPVYACDAENNRMVGVA